MSVFYETSSFFEESGSAVARFPEQVRDGIVGHACNIWGNFPDFFTRGVNPVSSWTRGYMNQVCGGIQSPPPLQTPDFTGGQCDGIIYNVVYKITAYNIGSCQLVVDETQQQNVTGPIGAVYINPVGITATTSCNGLSNDVVDQVEYLLPTKLGDVTLSAGIFNDPSGVANPPLSSVEILSVTRVDGLPDDCGDAPPQYAPQPPPAPGDLNTTINITNLDGTDNSISIEYNQVDNNYNFPMNFKVNGINATLSLGGLTIHGNTSITNNNGGEGSPPPGSDGGKNSDGDTYINIFDDAEYPELPEFTVPDLVDSTLEYLLCEEEVLDTITKVVKILPGTSPILVSILEVLSNIVRELCQGDDLSDVGVPEIYPVLPGADRPVCVFYYKEILEDRRGFSTYTSTLPNPSNATIAGLSNLVPPDRVLGKYVVALRLTDGSRIIARGNTEAQADAYFQFLLNRVSPGVIPTNILELKTVTKQERFNEVEVKCTQVEYYPDGKSFGRTASEKYLLSPE